LKHGLDEKLKVSTSSAVHGSPKVAGKKHRLEWTAAETKAIETTLKRWAKRRPQRGDLAAARRELRAKGSRAANGADISHSQVLTWLGAIREGHA